MLKVKRQKKQNLEVPPAQLVMGAGDIIPGISRTVTPEIIRRATPDITSIFAGVTASTIPSPLPADPSPVEEQEETPVIQLPLCASLSLRPGSPILVETAKAEIPAPISVEPPHPEHAHYDALNTWGQSKRGGVAQSQSVWKRIFG